MHSVKLLILKIMSKIYLILKLRYTIYSVEDLDFDANLLGQSLKKKLAFIENQIVARSMTNITAEQLEEYSQTFKSCDKANTNLLDRDGFKLALKAEGEEFSVKFIILT